MEILALIGINRHRPIEIKAENNSEPAVKTTTSTKSVFTCVCGQAPDPKTWQAQIDDNNNIDLSTDEETDDDISNKNDIKKRRKLLKNGEDKKKRAKLSPTKGNNQRRRNGQVETARTVYACILCGVFSHPDCLNYKGERGHFKCLQCCTKHPIESSCTLIVTPASICSQWRDEITKHMKSSTDLRVHIYNGYGEFRAFELAQLDVCITTYEVLASELDHVFAFETMRQLRRPQRYLNVPSPLQCIKWWRVCLDEAQLVHSTQTKCAAMANRLAAVNRW